MYPSQHSQNDTIQIITEVGPLSEMMDFDELLPIEMADMGGSTNSCCLYEAPTAEKTVRFGGIHSVKYIESSDDMTEGDRNERWFSRSELSQFKLRARQVCKDDHKGLQIAADESARGMDVYFPHRQRAHAKYIYHVVRAYHVDCAGNPLHVARLCEKWSIKATERSRAAAIQDVRDAYFPEKPCGDIACRPSYPQVQSLAKITNPAGWEPERPL